MSLKPSLDELITDKQGADAFPSFLVNHIQVGQPRLKPWSFTGHEFLMEPAQVIDAAINQPNAPKHIVFRKAAQMGVSTLGLAADIFINLAGYRTAYFLSTRAIMADFVRDRFDPMVSADPWLTAQIVEPQMQELAKRRKGKMPADNIRLKQIGAGSTSFCGMQKMDEVKSRALDGILLDEVSELPIHLVDWVDDRLLHSTLKLRIELSQPDVPQLGIDERFQESDQRFWTFRCGKCRKDVILELTFPDCLIVTKDGYKLGCPYCQSKLNPESARWVARYPERRTIGFALSQLYGPHISAEQIAEKWLKAQRRPSALANFNISILGLPYAGDRQPANDAVCNERCGDWEISPMPTAAGPQGTAYAGIDQGDLLHLVIRRRFADGISRVVWAEETPDWELVRKRLQAHNVAAFVVDAMPYKTSAKDLCRQMKNGAILYSNSKATHYGLEDGDTNPVHTVNVNRTELIDTLMDDFLAKSFWLPKRSLPQTQEMIEHFKKLVKDKRDDGSYEYKKNVANHYGMAAAMSLMAEEATGALNLGPPQPFGSHKQHISGSKRTTQF